VVVPFKIDDHGASIGCPFQQALTAHLDRFIEWLGQFPVPGGLKIIAEERKLSAADFPFPLSPQSTQARLSSSNGFVPTNPI
jgi:hypothetical protein